MLLSELEYVRPETVEEAVRLLSEHDNARVLAGGQTLINVMKLRFASPELLVDIGSIEGLRAITVGADGSVELGAMATYDDIERSEELARARPLLGEVAGKIADQQVRNMGTIGGNLCSNDPTNHFPPVLAALGGELAIAGPGGGRTVAADEFFRGVYETAVDPGEVLTSIRLPAPAPSEGTGFASLTIGRDGTGIVNVAAALRCNGSIEAARVAIGCVAAVPVRASKMEAALEGVEPTKANVRLAAEGLGATLDPPGDVHASADYRRHVAEVLAVRAVLQAIDRALLR
jgi:carbon-monoxide dehydrogenase medium subunit